jgi:NAD(P)-dependent dehydrogenase (short-subunit alcohol dehydrogenase family)
MFVCSIPPTNPDCVSRRVTFALYPSLADRVVFVTGGATGIGADIVDAFAQQQARVAFIDMQTQEGERLAERIAARGDPRPLCLGCDVTDIPALQAAIARVRDMLGPIGALVNNAANDGRHRVEDVSVEFWDKTQNVNLRHHFFAAQAVRPQMQALGGGSIINMSSTVWRFGAAEMPAYATAKSAVLGLTRALARAFGPDNIRVNAIEPGAVMTNRQRELWYKTEESVQAMVDRQLIRRVLLGEEIARMILFLAADDSRMITKQSFTVDAGLR